MRRPAPPLLTGSIDGDDVPDVTPGEIYQGPAAVSGTYAADPESSCCKCPHLGGTIFHRRGCRLSSVQTATGCQSRVREETPAATCVLGQGETGSTMPGFTARKRGRRWQFMKQGVFTCLLSERCKRFSIAIIMGGFFCCTANGFK